MVMGIVNVNAGFFFPMWKSFFECVRRPWRTRSRLVAQGAEILDIGGESTRPGAQLISRPKNCVASCPSSKNAAATKVPLSIDTMKPAIARAALAAGASIVNDVAAIRGDREMWRVVAEFQSRLRGHARAGFAVHAAAIPGIIADVVREVGEFFSERLITLVKRIRHCGGAGGAGTLASASARRSINNLPVACRPAKF